MSNADAEQRRSPQPVDRPPAIAPGDRLDPAAALDLILTGARLLFVNGQTTERTVEASEQFAVALGFRVTLFPRWGELMLRIQQDAGSRSEIVAAEPAGMESVNEHCVELEHWLAAGDHDQPSLAARSPQIIDVKCERVGLGKLAARHLGQLLE